MKFALANDERIEATKGAKGLCPGCGSELIAKCGEIVIHHWAHKKKCSDHWWESETKWHRNWKNNFPDEWQEIIQYDEIGERHIADVKTPDNLVIEFQHSAIKPEERRSRNKFYNKDNQLIWVVDCRRRKTDIKQFTNELFDSFETSSPEVLEVYADSRLIKEWKNNDSYVFLDFGDIEIGGSDFWCLCPIAYDGVAFITKIQRRKFINYLNNNNAFEKMFSQDINIALTKIKSHVSELKASAARRADSNPKFPPRIK
jgi:competence protein CoiA